MVRGGYMVAVSVAIALLRCFDNKIMPRWSCKCFTTMPFTTGFSAWDVFTLTGCKMHFLGGAS